MPSLAPSTGAWPHVVAGGPGARDVDVKELPGDLITPIFIEDRDVGLMYVCECRDYPKQNPKIIYYLIWVFPKIGVGPPNHEF